MLDTVINNARIVDGTGNPWFHGRIGIQDGRIAAVGRFEAPARRETDAGGNVVCPGFVDAHSHTDLEILNHPRPANKILQGVTTEAVGNCGQSMAPVNPATVDELRRYLGLGAHDLAWDWSSLKEFGAAAERAGLTANMVPLVGQGTLRNAVMGFDRRPATPEELGRMKDLLRGEMADGAFGLSSGLIYPPGLFTPLDEMIELARVVEEYGGLYATHVRSETSGLVDAVREAIEVGRASGVKVQISHHKACGRDNWGDVERTLETIEAARAEGIDVTADQYPYLASCTHLSAFLPPWAHEGGVDRLLERLQSPDQRARVKDEILHRDDWENGIKQVGWDRIAISRTAKEKDRRLEGQTLQEIADSADADPFERMFDLLVDNRADVRIFSFGVHEDDLRRVMRHPSTMFGTDGGAVPLEPEATPHPRNYGVYPRILGEYVRDKGVLPLEEAVRKMTSFPARKLGLKNRGLLREGHWADLVIFDPDAINDRADYRGGQWRPEGIRMVMVNGEPAAEDGRPSGRAAGRVVTAGGA
jgi:N-acyl-D-amino-acid deacylase